MSQNRAILEHLRAGHELSAIDALHKFGCLRLAARIDNLRMEGVEIETRIERKGSKHWAVYYIRQLELV